MKIKLLFVLVLAAGLSAETVKIEGDRVEVVGPQGTTVVQGANAHAAGIAIGNTAKAASDLGVGIAQAFGGQGANIEVNQGRGQNRVVVKNRDGSIGTNSNNVVVKSRNGTVADTTVVRDRSGRNVVVEDQNGKVEVETNDYVAQDGDEDGVILERNAGTKTDRYSIAVAGRDGSAGSYQGATNVEMIKDGTLETDDGENISYSGDIKFNTASGERKKLSGIITVTRE